MTRPDLPEPPKGYFWRIKANPLTYSPFTLQLRRDFGLFSWPVQESHEDKDRLIQSAWRMLADLAEARAAKAIHGDYRRKR